MTPSRIRGRLLAVADDQGRRQGLLLVAILLNFGIVFLNLLDVFDGAPGWVEAVVLAVQVLVVLPLLVLVVVGTVRERRARQEERR